MANKKKSSVQKTAGSMIIGVLKRFRSLSRLSSALSAKASSLRSLQLNL